MGDAEKFLIGPVTVASMRPRRARLGWGSSRWGREKPGKGFNEAEARTPRMAVLAPELHFTPPVLQ